MPQRKLDKKAIQNRPRRCDGGFQIVIDHLMVVLVRERQFPARVGNALLNHFLRLRMAFAQALFERLEFRSLDEDRYRVGTSLFYLLPALYVNIQQYTLSQLAVRR